MGHTHGDLVLRAVALALQELVGSRGEVARWGGEEFLVLMTGTDLADAVEIVEGARRDLGSRMSRRHRVAPATFSAGVVAAAAGVSWESAIHEADALLYAAKDAGRNRVHAAYVPAS